MSGFSAVRRRSRRLALAALFGVMVFISKIFLPTPLDKIAIVFQAVFLGLGSIMLAPLGATLVSVIAGLLTSAWRAPFAIFTLAFAILYGLLVDTFSSLFRTQTSEGNVRTGRLVAAVTAATALTGMTSYYITVHGLSLLPRNIALEMAILILGVISGAVGGYLAGLLWRKTLRRIAT